MVTVAATGLPGALCLAVQKASIWLPGRLPC